MICSVEVSYGFKGENKLGYPSGRRTEGGERVRTGEPIQEVALCQSEQRNTDFRYRSVNMYSVRTRYLPAFLKLIPIEKEKKNQSQNGNSRGRIFSIDIVDIVYQ